MEAQKQMAKEGWKNYTKDIELNIGDRVLIDHNVETLYVGVIIHVKKNEIRCVLHNGEEYAYGSVKEKWPILMYETDHTFYRKELLEILMFGDEQDYEMLFPERKFVITIPGDDNGEE